MRKVQNEELSEGYMKSINTELAEQKGYDILAKSLKPWMLEYENIPRRIEKKYPNIDYSVRI